MNAMRQGLRTFYLVLLLGVHLGIPSVRGQERPAAEERKPVSLTDEYRAKPDSSKNEIYLVEPAVKPFRVVKAIDQSERLYVKKTKTTRKYEHFLTDRFGKLWSPQQYLLAGTILRGDRLGAKPERFYVLTPDGNWRRSVGPEIYLVKDDDSFGEQHTLTPAPDPTEPPKVANTSVHSP
jgi:hypothetical protein